MTDRLTEEQRQRIDALLDVQAKGAPAGIFGREWCEACGQLGSFVSFAGAIASHRDGKRFVCWQCCDGNRPRAGSAYNKPLDALILERGFRYCHGCGQEVVIRPYRVQDLRQLPFTCPDCEGLDRGTTARRRYLEHKASQDELEEIEARIRWAKREIEQIYEELEQGQAGSDNDSNSAEEE